MTTPGERPSPEIRELVESMLDALTDPSKNYGDAKSALLAAVGALEHTNEQYLGMLVDAKAVVGQAEHACVRARRDLAVLIDKARELEDERSIDTALDAGGNPNA